MSEPTKEILIARHSGTMFQEMGGENLLISAKKILADLSVLTGIKLPEGSGFSQLSIFLAESLKEDYTFMTVPLMQQAFKKHSGVLTTGKEKSYGRTLSLPDIHQVMDAYSGEITNANSEVDELLQKDTKDLILSETDKENIIREAIQQQLESGAIDCTYAEFNQLLKDGLLTEQSLTKQGWNGLQSLKKKYGGLLDSVKGLKDDDVKSLKYALSAKNYQEKLDLIIELEDEIKAEVAGLYLKYCKETGKKIYAQ